MKNLPIYLLLLVFATLTISCSNDNETEPTLENLKNVTDCSLSYSADDNEYVIGICLDGTTSALPGEIITFASKATPNFTEIVWTVESGSIEIMNIENSVENSVEIGRLKTIATIKFNSDFSGGSIRSEAVNNIGEYVGVSHQIEMENNE